ncbi:MAG: hypothetical protein IJ833_09275 [Lachnospiraceae bacterium]|nr:hypothetical protein [Lachnospiraceae bacterium]
MGTAILNSVYNNYLSTYTPKSLTRYDTHKKSELRGVYNSIVKMNKESPWYLPTTNKDTQAYAVDLKENARELHNTIAQLGGLEEKGLLNKKNAFSSDESIATATYVGPPNPDDEVPHFELNVKALASPQENLGMFLSNERIELPEGTYSFDVAINDMNYEFQFSIGESETNRDVQERLGRLINNSDIGIRASVVESEGRTSLRMVSESSGLPLGKSSIFTVSDDHTSKNAGTVDYFGLDYISRHAANARFSIDGEEHAASSNHFTIGKVYEVELKGISGEDGSIEIGLKPDVESFADSVNELIGGYNDFIKAASNYMESQSRSRTLVREMTGIASTYRNSLEAMGVNIAEDGTMNVDNELLRQAALDSEDVSETFAYMKDFSNSLLRKSNQVSLNPMDYVEKTIVAYKNPGHNFVSPYASSAYSGMMFNGYC